MSNRKDYFFRQKVSEAELDDGFNDLEVADRQMMIDLGLIGVLQNAVVTEKSGTPDLTVDISGSASIHDKLGQRIGFGPLQNIDVSVDENSNSTEPPPGNELIVSVFAKFDRVLSDPRIDGNSATVFFERAETFDFVVRQGAATATPPATPSALDVEYILLADIQRTNGQTQVLNANITPPGGTYTAISNRREEAFKLSAGALDILAGTPETSDQAILTELNNHITGVSNAHDAVAVDYAGGGAWHDGTTNPGGVTVEAQLDKIITDLVNAAGSDRIGAAAHTAAGNGLIDLSAGSIQDQLRAIVDRAVAHDATQTITGNIILDGANPSITFNNAAARIYGPTGAGVFGFEAQNATSGVAIRGPAGENANFNDTRFQSRRDMIVGFAGGPETYIHADVDGLSNNARACLGVATATANKYARRFARLHTAWHHVRIPFGAAMATATAEIPSYASSGGGSETTGGGNGRGVLHMISPSAGNQSRVSMGNHYATHTGGGCITEWIVEPTTVVTNVILRLGMKEDPNSINLDGGAEDTYYVRYDTGLGDSFWTLVSNNSGAQTVAAASVAPANGVKQRITLVADEFGDLELYINGVQEATLAGTFDSQRKNPVMRIETLNATPKEWDIESVEVWWADEV
jgi:hypothetical protein